MNPQMLEYYADAFRREEDLKRAELHRMRRRVYGVNTDLPRPCCAALAWFGHRLVVWGRRLERTYGQLGVGPNAPFGHA